MALPSVSIVRREGALTAVSVSQDNIYGFIIGAPSGSGGYVATNHGAGTPASPWVPKLLRSLEDLSSEAFITETGAPDVYNHVSEFYRVASTSTELWIVVVPRVMATTYEKIFGTGAESAASRLMDTSYGNQLGVQLIWTNWEDLKSTSAVADAVEGFTGGIVGLSLIHI